jgi:fatty acid desaturase
MTARITPTSGPLTAEQVRQFSARSSLTGAFHLGMHLGLAVVLAALLWRTWGSLWTPVLWCAVGVVINYLYAAQHELSHGTVFTSRRANELWGRVIGTTTCVITGTRATPIKTLSWPSEPHTHSAPMSCTGWV